MTETNEYQDNKQFILQHWYLLTDRQKSILRKLNIENATQRKNEKNNL